VLAQEEIAQIDALSKRSQLALDDMTSAVKTLKASGEFYNATILAGMVTFVEDVEREVSAKSAMLMKTTQVNPNDKVESVGVVEKNS